MCVHSLYKVSFEHRIILWQCVELCSCSTVGTTTYEQGSLLPDLSHCLSCADNNTPKWKGNKSWDHEWHQVDLEIDADEVLVLFIIHYLVMQKYSNPPSQSSNLTQSWKTAQLLHATRPPLQTYIYYRIAGKFRGSKFSQKPCFPSRRNFRGFNFRV